MAWICIGFFGLGIPVGLAQAFDRRPQIIIDKYGIWDRSTKQDKIPWEEIIDAYPLIIYRQKLVCLITDGLYALKKNWSRPFQNLSKTVGAQDVNLLMSQLKMNEKTMTAFVKEMIAAEPENRNLILDKYFSRL